MKSPLPYFISHGLCILLGAVLVFFITNRKEEAPIIKETFTAEKHAEEIQKPVHNVRAQGKKAVFTYEVPTERYGLLKGEVQASRGALQYRHRAGIGAVVLNNSVLGRVSYGYKNVDFSLYGGWDYKNRGAVFGAGLGYSWGF